MKIFEFCPFLNENRAAEIKIKENSYWVDQLHIFEANKTFSFDDKIYNFNKSLLTDKVIYHPYDVNKIFRRVEETPMHYSLIPSQKKFFDKWYWMLINYNGIFYNEAIQRNFCTPILREFAEDDDIIILSDMDEIIDNRFADKIISEVKKHQIISVKLYYTAFFLNLFCSSCTGAPNFSYRIFIMTGRYFKTMPFSSDYLRKKGFENKFAKEIYCLKEFAGFHHTFLDYQNTSELKTYAYRGNTDDKNGLPKDYADMCISNKRLYHNYTKLYVDNRINLLRSISEIENKDLFYKI